MKNLYVHLTNSCLHSQKEDYMNDEDEMDEEHGPKRLFTRVLEQLEDVGFDPNDIKE